MSADPWDIEPNLKPEPHVWRYTTRGGLAATVIASSVTFEVTHVVWRDQEGSVVLAERPENVNELVQVGTLGSSARGTRPAREADR